MEKGHIHAGLVRVVWELNDVAIDSGGERPPGCGFSTAANLPSVAAEPSAFWWAGTHFIPGSHKSAFIRPPSLSEKGAKFWKTYACPAGSAIVALPTPHQPRSCWSSSELWFCVGCRSSRSR